MLKATLFGIVGGVIGVVVVMLIGDAVSGPLLTTGPGADVPEEAPLGGAVFFTVLGGFVGLGLATLAERFFGNPVVAFVGICVVALVAYGVFAFSASEEVSTGVWLNLAHIAAAVPIVGSLTKQLQAA